MASFLTGPVKTDQWAIEAKRIFSDCELESETETSPTLKTIFKNLYTSYRDNIKSWWEVQSLENYIKANIVPRGLRINILPAPRVRSTQLLETWEKELTSSSVRLMQILLEEEKRNLEITSKNLKSLIDQTLKFKNDPEFSRKEENLQGNIEKFQNVLKDRKHKQFKKDTQEFKDNKAYQFLSEKEKERESEASSSDLEASDTERSYNSNYLRKRGSGRSRGSYRGWGSNRRGRWQPPQGRSWERNWYPPQGYPPQGLDHMGGERREIPPQGQPTYPMGPPTYPMTGPPLSSSSSSCSAPPPFLEGNGGAPYDLRERKRAH